MKLTPWLVLLSLSLASCSGSKSAQKVNEETPQIELSDADEFIENPSDEQPVAEATAAEAPQDAIAEDTGMESNEVIEEPVVTDSEPMVTESSVEPTLESANNLGAASTSAIESAAPVVSNDFGATKEYTVQKNETLMLIAFKLYGDYERWKDLANQNRNVLKGNTALKNGTVLKYTAPAEEFVWNPQGNPYLIRTGDTLGGISKEVYATRNKWKLIWDNNRPLIKNPNKIYAGFTIYYLENGREVANEI
jgi:nucleoid-associated protein YgaU